MYGLSFLIARAEPNSGPQDFPYTWASPDAPAELLALLTLGFWTLYCWKVLRMKRCDGHEL